MRSKTSRKITLTKNQESQFMQPTQKVLMGIVATGILTLALPSQAAFDANVTGDVIFGTGNANGSWTVAQGGGVELGLRAKVRFPSPANVFNSNGDGTYNHLAGNDAGRALWNYEWSINSDFAGTSGVKLDDLTYMLRIDTDPTAAINYTSNFDPINTLNPPTFWDHSIGDNSTLNGQGAEATDQASYLNLIANNNLAQQSWRFNWYAAPFNPNVSGSYTFALEAYNGLTRLAATEMTVNVAVPEPSTYLAGALLLLPFGASMMRKLRKA
jgi:hypothetical protein